MPRAILTEQKGYEFSHSLTVRTTDINYVGHLGNEALLGLVHEARARFLKVLNFNTMIDDGQQVGLIIADMVVNFRSEAFAFDQLTIDCLIGELREKSFRLFHRIRREQQLIALIETGMMTFAYRDKSVVGLPGEFLKGLQDYRNAIGKAKIKMENLG